jgi:1,2-phenylacetyl-CoA epoxidase catalytic subunit
MSSIGGKVRETQESNYTKKVGLFEAKIIAVNPTLEQFKDVLGMEVQEDSKLAEYLGESKDGNNTLRVDFWLEEVKNGDKFKVSFFLEDKERENKDGTKQQYINEIGMCAWADDPNNLPEWFTKREYRQAYTGEEDLYNFLRTWLGKLDYRDADTVLQLEWKKLMKGNVRDIKDQVGGEYATNVVALATVITKERDGEIKEYQGIYNRAFLPAYSLKNFRLVDYSSREELSRIAAKKSSELKPHERFVLNITGEYGCKDYYILKDLQEYNPDDNLVASDATLSSDGGDY